MDAKGMFYEWSTYREFSLAEQSTGLISGILGMNDGYVSDGHNGANFYAFSFGLERAQKSFCFLGMECRVLLSIRIRIRRRRPA